MRQEDRAIALRAEVANTGLVAGATVVQAYAGLPGSRFERPQWRLVAFSRVDLGPGEQREIEMEIALERLAVRDNGDWLVEPGDYVLTLARYAGDPDGQAVRVHVEA